MQTRHLLLFSLFLSTWLLIACQTSRQTDTTSPTQQVVFGNGGGFTGQVTQYTLHADGKIVLTDPLTNESKQIHSLNKKETAKFFKEAEQLNLAKLNFNYPGNLYYFIQLQDQETKQSITWGATERAVPAPVQQLYEKLIAVLPKKQ